MIEVNRTLYMNEASVKKTSDFLLIKKMINQYYSHMQLVLKSL